jgi:hypothetical protein
VSCSCSACPPILHASPELACALFCIGFLDAVCGQVAKFVRHPVSERAVVQDAIGVNENRLAGQVRKHSAGVSGGHMKLKGFRCVQVLPVRHEYDSRGKQIGVHSFDLRAQQRFFVSEWPPARVAIRQGFNCGFISGHGIRLSVGWRFRLGPRRRGQVGEWSRIF